MKTLLLIIGLSLLSLISFGQGIVLSFSGCETVTHDPVSIDSVLVRNLTRNCDTTLYGNNPELEIWPAGIDDLKLEQHTFDLIQNYPNPFQDQTNFVLVVKKKEKIRIQVFTLLGQTITEFEKEFQPGIHLFSFIGTQNNIYLLTASSGRTVKSLKLLSTRSGNGFNSKLIYVAFTTDVQVLKRSIISERFTFEYGDQLEYTGFSFGYINRMITDSPQTSMSYVFEFDIPFTFSCGDSLEDERDGKSYETVQIGNQCWISENLNIGTRINGSENQLHNTSIEKYCYNDNETNCDLYGGLYQWDEMMQYDTSGANQGICPEGWRLPTISEWDTLIQVLGGDAIAGEALKKGGLSGFNALMGGKREMDGSFSYLGTRAYFSSTSQTDESSALNRYVINDDPGVFTQNADKEEGFSVRCIKGYPNKLNPAVFVIDSTVYRLISDSLELDQGIYRYEILREKHGDSIGPGNVIIGLTGEGYLREVNEVSQYGNELTLFTDWATLEDVWDSGEFNFNIDLGNTRNINGYWIKNYLADGVSIRDTEDGEWEFAFEDVTILQEGIAKISLPSGYLRINPNFDFNMIFTLLNGLEYFSVRADSATFEAETKLQLSLSDEIEIGSYEKEIASYSKYRFIPPLFIIVITIELKVKDVISAGVTWTATTGYTQSRLLDLGLIYQNNTWGKIWNHQVKKDSIHPVEYNVMVNLTNKLSLIPEISIKVYGATGPYCDLDFYKKLNARMSLYEPHCWDMDVSLGLSGKQAIDPSILLDEDWDIQVWTIDPLEKSIWNFPDSIIYIKGNDQTGVADETLPDSLIVKVVDNLGYGWPMVPVQYIVTAGYGSLSDSVAFTDNSGYARSTWKLGPVACQNKVKAQVRKADLITHIKSSPYIFEAIAWEPALPCPEVPTVTYEGQIYNTVQIGEQCWLKENLNVGTRIDGTQNQTDNQVIEKYCYDDLESNCDIYGGLYQWDEMMDWEFWAPYPQKGICPEGWHLPTDWEWNELEGTVDSQFGVGDDEWNLTGFRGFDAGKNLKSASGWYENQNGMDKYGFTALPGGVLYNGIYDQKTEAAWFRTKSSSYWRLMNVLSDGVFRYSYNENNGGSVRCVLDW